MSTMKPREQTKWAQEMILEFIDDGLILFHDDGAHDLDADDDISLKKERNRIAKLFRLPEK